MSKPNALKMTPGMKQHIAAHLGLQWSPEQIQSQLQANKMPSVCPKTIYQLIAQNKAAGGDLHKNRRHKKYRQRTGKPDARGQIRNRVSIEERAAIVDQKQRIGDWEADTVIGKGHKGVLVTLTEHYSKLNLISHVASKHAGIITQAMIDMVKPYQADLQTIPFDNGMVFAFA